MTTQQNSVMPDPAPMPDPRPHLSRILSDVGEIVGLVGPEQMSRPTPCDEFDVATLLDHLVMIGRRIAVVGKGEHWSSVQQESIGSGHAETFTGAAVDALASWDNDAQLGQMFEVPWGTLPGAPVLFTYVGELAVHGWDLAMATGHEFAPADVDLLGGWMSLQQIPRGGRDDDAIPFGEVFDVADDAPLLHKMAGWVGRAVS